MLQRIWNLLCSLKLTIILASAATVLTMTGSIVMIKYPKTFGDIDTMILADWFQRFGNPNLAKSWWFGLVCVLLALLALNTLCCLLDWLPKIRSRWRKSGEYLIHLGFVLFVIAFAWGSVSGARSENNRIVVGETIHLDALAPGYSLRLEQFEPEFGPEGRPNDLRSTLTLLRGGNVIEQGTIRLNHPLIVDQLVILPGSFNQIATGFRFSGSNGQPLELKAGTILPLPNHGRLRVISFLPDVTQGPDGRIYPRSDELQNPAFELEWIAPGHEPWRGWYILRQGLPAPLTAAGIVLQPIEPLTTWVSILTINRDPGAGLALVAGLCLGGGVLFALISFYYKRERGDRPEII